MSIDRKDYDKFIQGLEIINTIFPEASWKVHYLPSKRAKIQNEIELELPNPIISQQKDRIVVRANLKLKGKTGKTNKPVFEIFLTQHFIIKVIPETFSDEIFKAYVQRNALLSIISVFREKIKEISFQMGLPPLVLPALKFTSHNDAEVHKKEKSETV